MAESLCLNCVNSIFCPTWAEVKCKVREKRIYNHAVLTDCGFYKKRDKNFKESPCQCEDCLKNEFLERQEETYI